MADKEHEKATRSGKTYDKGTIPKKSTEMKSNVENPNVDNIVAMDSDNVAAGTTYFNRNARLIAQFDRSMNENNSETVNETEFDAVRTVDAQITNAKESDSVDSDEELNGLLGSLQDQINVIKRRLKNKMDRMIPNRPEQIAQRDDGLVPKKIVSENLAMDRDGSTKGGNTFRIPKSGWICNPFDELKFFGESDKQNPVIFLRRFQSIAKYEEITRDAQMHEFKRVLKGAAKHWIEAINPCDIETAQSKFLEMYWGRAAQKQFRRHLYDGKYQADRGTSMSEYAINLIHSCQMLNPPMSERDIIDLLQDHYGVDIAREIRPSTVSNLSDLIILLKDIESTRTPKPYEGDLYKFGNASKQSGGQTRVNNNNRVADQTRANNNSQSNAQRKQGQRDNKNKGRSDQNDPKTSNVDGKQTQPFVKSAYKGRYNQSRTQVGPQQVGRSGPIITEVSDEETTQKEVPKTKAIGWNGNDKGTTSGTNQQNKTNYQRGGYQNNRKRISTMKSEGTTSDNNVYRNDAGGSQSESDYEPNLNIIRTKRILEDLDEDMKDAHRSKKFKEWDVPIIKIEFARTTAKALVDTGAQVSALTVELYKELMAKKEEIAVVPIKKFILRGAFTERGAVIANKVNVSFRYNGTLFTHDLFLVEKMAYRMILGIDFLTKNKMTMSLDRELKLTFEKDEEDTISSGRICTLTQVEANEALQTILNEQEEVFRDEIGRVSHYEHEIKIITDKPYKKKTYPIPQKHIRKVGKYIKEIESKGIIKKTATQYINPLVVVMKKNGDVRLCLDARELNKRMTNDHAQPPTIDDVFRRIGQRKVFSTLDISQAFWQIPLAEESKKYTGFLFNGQTYVFERMPFGLKTAGASFTRAMDLALGDETADFTIVYLDDILIASNSLEEHLEHVRMVLEKLKAVGFRLNKSKCEFLREEIKFLGHTFSEVEAEINDETRQAIQSFKRPKTKKDIQSFLGLVNWDRRFIKNLARIVRPLEELLQQGRKFQWGEPEQRAFDLAKTAFVEAPTLYLIRPGFQFGIFVDAALSGLGARLYQYREGSDEKYTVAYASRSLKGAETRYTVTELEGLALTWALRKWHTLLLGRGVRVHTDHKALQFLSTCVHNNQRIARWFAFLQEFDLDIRHIPGKNNEVADALSRSRDPENLQSNEEKTIALIRGVEEGVDPEKWVQVIRQAQQEDEEVQYRLREYAHMCYERDGLVRVQREDMNHDRVFIPEKLTWKLVQWIHRMLLHYGTDKIENFAFKYFISTNMSRVIRDVVASCKICQATKYYTRQTRGVEYYELPVEPGKVVSIDLFGPLPVAKSGKKYILVVMDQFSKHTKLYPMNNQKLDSIMEKLRNDYFPEVGVPEQILSDNGGQFVTARWARFADEMGFEQRKTSPYNPQSNPVERVMRELGRIIRAYASHSHVSWLRVIPIAERVMNETVHASTGYSPNELQFNENTHLGLPEQLLPREIRKHTWQHKINEANANLKRAAEKRKKQSDKHPERSQYQVGDWVWLKLHRHSDAKSKTIKKIHLVYDGPYQILQVIRRNAYLLGNLDGEAVTSANSRQLKPHREAKLENKYQQNYPRAQQQQEEASEGGDNSDEYQEADPNDIEQEPEEEYRFEDDAYQEEYDYRDDDDRESQAEDSQEQDDQRSEESEENIYNYQREYSSEEETEKEYSPEHRQMVVRKPNAWENIQSKYPVKYKDDGVTKSATYYSKLNKPHMKGKATLTFQETGNTESVIFRARTQTTRKRHSKGGNGEERMLKHKRLPEITMGALYTDDFHSDYESTDELDDFIERKGVIPRLVIKDNKWVVMDGPNIPEGDTDAGAEAVVQDDKPCESTQRASVDVQSPHQNTLSERNLETENKNTKNRNKGNKRISDHTYASSSKTINGEEHKEVIKRKPFYNQENTYLSIPCPEKNLDEKDYTEIQVKLEDIEPVEIPETSLQETINNWHTILIQEKQKNCHSKNEIVPGVEETDERRNILGNGEEQRRITLNFDGKSAEMPGDLQNGRAQTVGTSSLLRQMLERDSRDDTIAMKKKDALDLKQKEELIKNASMWGDSVLIMTEKDGKNTVDKIIPREKQWINDDSLSETVSKNSGSDSMFETLIIPEEMRYKEKDYLPDGDPVGNHVQTLELPGKPKSIEVPEKRKNKVRKREDNNKTRKKRLTLEKLMLMTLQTKAEMQKLKIKGLRSELEKLKTDLNVNNTGLSFRVAESYNKNDSTLPSVKVGDNSEFRCGEAPREERNSIGQRKNQSENTVESEVKKYGFGTPANHTIAAAITHNLETLHCITEAQGQRKITMDAQEKRLLEEIDRLDELQDAGRRKRARITRLERVLEEMRKLPIPQIDVDELEAIRVVEETEARYNNRDQSDRIINLFTEASNKTGERQVEIDLTANLKYHSVEAIHKDTVMITILVRGQEATIKANMIGEVDVGEIHNISSKIPQPCREVMFEPVVRADIIAKANRSELQRNESRMEDDTSKTVQSHDSEAQERSEIQPTPSTSGTYKKKGSKARDHEKEESDSAISDLQETSTEEASSKEESPEEKTEKKIRSGKKKTRGKDGRRLPDLSNRIRDEKGRLLGYKKGTQSYAKYPRCKSSPKKKPEIIKVEKIKSKAMIKMPSQTPKLASQEFKKMVREMVTSTPIIPVRELRVTLDTPQIADVSRARRIQPDVFPEAEGGPEGATSGKKLADPEKDGPEPREDACEDSGMVEGAQE